MTQAGAPPRLGPPIAVQIIALLVAVLVLGQLATLAVVVVLPPPRPPVYRVDEIAAALKGLPSNPRYAPPLSRATSTTPPADGPAGDRHRLGLEADLARTLGVSEDQVRLRIEPRPFFSFPFAGGPGPRRRDRQRSPADGRGPSSNPVDDSGRADPLASPAAPLATGQGADAADQRTLSDDLGAGRRFRNGSDRWEVVVGQLEAAYAPTPGRWVVVKSPAEGFPNAWQRRMFLWFLACLLLLTPVGYLFARRLTAPLGRFASAADRLGRDPRAPPLTLSGPAEIGVAASAFNTMQARLARYVEDRTAMLGAIAHDLRTPLARVQFKLQRAPSDLASDIRKDLGQMEAMIAAVLAFVRDVAPTHERARLDLLSLLEVVADDATETGADVELEAGPAVIVEGDASALQRLFVNLVDNAVKYGERARISLRVHEEDVVVAIADDGPGIAAEELERVFEPFHRVETSRSRETGGIGLGLSVARSIARAHGGDVLLQSQASGLTAIVRLPTARFPA